jgi:hypothetical protein
MTSRIAHDVDLVIARPAARLNQATALPDRTQAEAASRLGRNTLLVTTVN